VSAGRISGPLRTTVIIAGVVIAPFALLLLLRLVLSSPVAEHPMFVDTSEAATCVVEPAIRGSTTTISLPLEKTSEGAASEVEWHIRDIVIAEGTNALISTKSFVGVPPGGEVQIAVRPLIPGIDYSIDGVWVQLASGDKERVQTMRLAMTSDDARCDVGVGSEVRPMSD